MPEINISTGIIDLPVNGKRTIKLNPRDPNEVYKLVALMDNVQAIYDECEKKIEKNRERGKDLNYYKARDKRITETIDSVYGDGFWNEAFDFVNPFAVTDDGLYMLEAFAYSVMDRMNESTLSSLEKRNARIDAYTSKWKNRGRTQKQTVETPTGD